MGGKETITIKNILSTIYASIFRRNYQTHLWTTFVMNSSVQIRASDSPLYSLQDTCLESITSITTRERRSDRTEDSDKQKNNIATDSIFLSLWYHYGRRILFK